MQKKINGRDVACNVSTWALCLLVASFTAHAQSPYINKVYDYVPAPGQFINVLPEYEPGDT
ncbi:MAG: hypothetical protein LBD53_07550, partial [Tannerella sp.]|nr:hypothetical protein [Tannerella sp.]